VTRRLAIAIGALCCVGPAIAATNAALVAGAAAEHPLQPGETQEFSVSLRPGDYLAIDLEERGVDITLRVLGPDDLLLAEQQTPFSSADSDSLRMIAAQRGQFRVQVIAKSPSAGKYQMSTLAIRPATSQDRSEVAASDAFHTAARMADKKTPEDIRGAIGQYLSAIHFARESHDSNLLGEASLNVGRFSFSLDERDQAVEYTTAALAAFRKSRNTRREAAALNNLGAIYEQMDQPTKAIDCFAKALPILHASGDAPREAAVLHNLAWYHQQLGEYSTASDYYRRALLLDGGGPSRANTLNNLGRLSASLGDYEAARDYLQQALTECGHLDDARCKAETLGNLGSLHLYQHEPDAARDQFAQVLAITDGLQYDVYRAKALLGLAAVDVDPSADRAGEHIRTAIALARDIKDPRVEADALRALGDWHRWRNSPDSARASYEQALHLYEETGDIEGEAETLLTLAGMMREAGDLQGARRHVERAIEDRESLRGQVARPDLRSTYLASTQEYYDLYVDVLMDLHAQTPSAGYDRKALQASEQARARGLLEALAERSSDALRGSDPKLLERERGSRRALNTRDQRLRSLAAEAGSPDKIANARQELNAALDDLREVEGEIRSRNPRYAELTHPAPLNIPALQRKLDDDSVLIEYWLGAKRSFVWTVTSHGVSSHVLPAGAVIESEARAYFTRLKTRPLGGGAGSAADMEQDTAGRTLSRYLLGSLTAELGHRRLIVVRYGALEYIPFAALPVGDEHAVNDRWLIQSHEIIGLPAASILGALRKPPQAPRKTIAIFADPVFSRDDPRVVRNDSRESNGFAGRGDAAALQRSGAEAGIQALYRLRYSRLEADAIAALVPKEQRLEALDFDANRTAALSRNMSQFRFLHFATHGLLDSVHPELSGLVFSAVDAHGDSQDALVRLHEIFGLSLRADLVVLSACQTALGREIRGEGLVGLTRGFMYAGAPRVIATVWNVDDRATAEFMTRFYTGVLQERLSASVSLRAAQLALLKDPRWSSPYYWGGIVLQGDWN
jgi:CHAT domain-containing protein/tetratricopeptide (TPR) repeat protein